MDKCKEPILILGGGHQGLSMAAHLAICGECVYLWNRSANHISKILKTNIIHCSGVINGDAYIDRVSSNIDDVLSRVIMVTTPANAHRDIARMLAKRVTKDNVIILNPGRTFGAIEFARVLREEGCMELPYIAEAQTIVYTCRRNEVNSAVIYALKNEVQIASLNCDDLDIIFQAIPDCIRMYFVPVKSVIATSFDNVGMVLHCAPVMMNVGWIESEKADFKYYYNGISRSVADFIEKIDAERLAVSAVLGYQIESAKDWMKRTYKVTGDNLYQCIRNNESYKEIDAPPTIYCRYILEDVPNGLVPIEYLGEKLGIATPCITTIINLAIAVLNMDFRSSGRRFSLEEIRKYL